VDTEKKTDDENGSETDDIEEHEWTPDQELDFIDNSVKESMKPTVTETIDLCDSDSCSSSSSSSSYDIGGDSDFTVASDYDVVRTKVKTKTGISSKSAFRKNRDRITNLAFEEFNQNVFGSELGCVEIVWSKKLNTSAGLTRFLTWVSVSPPSHWVPRSSLW